MFKKRVIKTRPARVSRRETSSSSTSSSDNNNEEDEEDGGNNNNNNNNDQPKQHGEKDDDNETSQRILQAKKKRKLLTDLQYKRGVNAQDLLAVAPAPSMAANDGPSRQSRSAGDSAIDNNDKTQGLWEKKHKQAMEDFIQQKLHGDAITTTQKPVATNRDHSQPRHDLPADEQELYQELAAKARELSGKSSASSSSAAAAAAAMDHRDADTGTGGALLAGTGIAEVILPPQRQSERPNHNAAVKNKNSLPTSWASHHAVPSRFAQPSVRSNVEMPQQFMNDPQQQQQQQESNAKAETVTKSSSAGLTEVAVVDGRIGFEAARRGASSVKRHMLPPKQQATDDSVYRKFVGHVREQQHKK